MDSDLAADNGHGVKIRKVRCASKDISGLAGVVTIKFGGF